MDQFSELFSPVNWLKDAKIFNHAFEQIQYSDLIEGQLLVLYFSSRGVDKGGIIATFSDIYTEVCEDFPIKVINVPLDETDRDMKASFEEQANWLTLDFGDPMITFLMYMYEITAMPHLIVMDNSCSVISYHGVLELEEYGKNALVSWLTATLTVQKKKSYRRSLFAKGSSCSVNSLLSSAKRRAKE